ncbi:NUDIX hydrolase [Halocatena salina]|uniref:NUDIX domain-containing protein n=1 Tax=Halocatena salina TaxID=2934340 RepID=A0A8U0A2Q0_9EURY|nr:NUDIX domain-containing protein [Halocatena salina]UPM42257.1 NUDIX domain-containing protein [Halocatena salina]
MSDDRAYVCNVEGAVSNGSAYLLGMRSHEEEHAAGELSLIGGTVDAETDGDVLQATVRREIREETTVEVGEMAYVESHQFHTDDGTPVVNVVFLCQYESGTAVAAEPEEIASVQWMSAKEITSHPDTQPWTRRSVEKAERRRLELGW